MIYIANRQHLALLKQGVDAWNEWRKENPALAPNLRGANLRGANLPSAGLVKTDLGQANLREANLRGANLRGADLTFAELVETDLGQANLRGANLRGANLSNADLTFAGLVETDLGQANLTNCSIYGISIWGVNLEGASQSNLVITPPNELSITVDNLEAAQFVYLILNNQKIRDVINTLTSKTVLILGRFTLERKRVLDALREELRKQDFLPVLFDVAGPSYLSLTETISTLASIAKFIIADITDKSILQELQSIVPVFVKPVQLILQSSPSSSPSEEYAMFSDFSRYPWVLMPYHYDSISALLDVLEEKVIVPAVRKAEELEKIQERFRS